MFSLRRGKSSHYTEPKENPVEHDEFGWWLADQNPDESSLKIDRCEESRSSGSSGSMVSCVDSDDAENYAIARDFARCDSTETKEKIELTCFKRTEVENGTKDQKEISAPENNCQAGEEVRNDEKMKSKPWQTQGSCYTPERLIRSQEYRIIMPPPRYLSLSHARLITPENETPRRSPRRCTRRRFNYLVARSKDAGTSILRSLDSDNSLSPTNDNGEEEGVVPAGGGDGDFVGRNGDEEGPVGLRTLNPLVANRSSYEKLCGCWDDTKDSRTRGSSLEDTSGIHSNDWSTDTPSETCVPLCLCDEIAIASENPPDIIQCVNPGLSSTREELRTDPGKINILFEEDRFCDSISSHDHLTRLALAIETDEVYHDSDNTVKLLRRKIEKLRASNRDIYDEVRTLRNSFQSNEKKLVDISTNITRLRQDVKELRYLDDLLKLLRGELERVSNRDWPFALGHTEKNNRELNLIV